MITEFKIYLDKTNQEPDTNNPNLSPQKSLNETKKVQVHS